MQGKYYRIGEFSKLTGASIKSLRYYDKIGVLKPNYVDKETKYRYYIPEQIIELNIIKLCLSLNLPLKTLKWKSNNTNLENLIETGKQKAEQVIKETYRMLDLISDIKLQIDRLNTSHNNKEVYKCKMNERQVLVTEWSESDNGDKYIEKIAELNAKAKENDLTILTQQGILYSVCDKKYFAYIIVKGDYSGEGMLYLKEKEYSCMILQETEVKKVPDIVNRTIGNAKFVFFLNTDIFDFCLSHPMHMLEIQCI